MSESMPDDWTRLSDEWRAVPVLAQTEQLRSRVKRQSRLLYATFAVEVALTVIAVAALAWALTTARSWDGRLVAVGLGLFTARIWAFTLQNRRGTFRAAADTLEAWRALERRRHERRIEAARFAWRISAAMLPLVAALLFWRALRRGPVAFDTLAAATGVVYLAGWVIFGRRRERALRSRT